MAIAATYHVTTTWRAVQTSHSSTYSSYKAEERTEFLTKPISWWLLVTASYSSPNTGCVMLQISKLIAVYVGVNSLQEDSELQRPIETFSAYTVSRKLVADLPVHAHTYSVRLLYFLISWKSLVCKIFILAYIWYTILGSMLHHICKDTAIVDEWSGWELLSRTLLCTCTKLHSCSKAVVWCLLQS